MIDARYAMRGARHACWAFLLIEAIMIGNGRADIVFSWQAVVLTCVAVFVAQALKLMEEDHAARKKGRQDG